MPFKSHVFSCSKAQTCLCIKCYFSGASKLFCQMPFLSLTMTRMRLELGFAERVPKRCAMNACL